MSTYQLLESEPVADEESEHAEEAEESELEKIEESDENSDHFDNNKFLDCTRDSDSEAEASNTEIVNSKSAAVQPRRQSQRKTKPPAWHKDYDTCYLSILEEPSIYEGQ